MREGSVRGARGECEGSARVVHLGMFVCLCVHVTQKQLLRLT